MDIPRSAERVAPPPSVVVSSLAGLAGAWIAAGSIGLMGHPFRRALVWGALLCVLLAAKPQRARRVPFILATLAAALAAILMVGVDLPAANVLAVGLVLVAAAVGQAGVARRTLLVSAEAVAILALYRLSLTSIASLWLAADSIAQVLGTVAGGITRQPLWIGPSFAGLDFLVVMGYLACRATLASGGVRRPRNVFLAVTFVLVGHLLYLNALSCVPKLVESLPEPSPEGGPWTPYPPPPGLDTAVARVVQSWGIPRSAPTVRFCLNGVFRAGQAVRGWLPWNVPILAALLHLAIAWAILRWLTRFADETGNSPGRLGAATIAWASSAALTAAAIVLAAALPMAGNLCLQPAPPRLDGKKIVLFENLYGNWQTPAYPDSPMPPAKDSKGYRTYVNWGRLAIGMYGMMPPYLESMGAQVVVSPDLSETDLRGADALIVIFPHQPWQSGQLERIWDFVRAGGSLLVMGEHTILNEALVRQHRELDETLADDLKKHAGRTQGKKRGAELTEEERELQRQITERVQNFLKKAPGSYFNELLDPTSIRVAYDSATFAVGGWLQSYQPLAHPTTVGVGDTENLFGAVIGASLDVRWPARPLLVGKWGWNDPGDPLSGDAMMGNGEYDAGERLGDVVLAAEQPLGKGRVVVFGDTSGLSNGLMFGCHPFTSRLFDYLANPVSTPQDASRQAAAALLALALASAIVVLSRPERIAAVAVVASLSLWICTAMTHHQWTVLPDGDLRTHRWTTLENGKRIVPSEAGEKKLPNNLAYIDASHLGAYSAEQWRDDGLMGLAMTLMRNDYVPLMLPELTRERLLKSVAPAPEPPQSGPIAQKPPAAGGRAAGPQASAGASKPATEQRPEWACRARLLVTVAPMREFTAGEREILKDFIRAGGIFLCTVGYENQGPSRQLLSELGFYVGGRQWQYREGTDETVPTVHFKAGAQPSAWYDASGAPKPLGHFKSPFFDASDQGYVAYVRFHSGWGVESPIPSQLVVSNYPPDVPLIVVLRHGKGLAVVIGDSGFAMNKNLEFEGGFPFEGMRENAVFWRWFLSLLRQGVNEGEVWFPQKIDTLSEDAIEKLLKEGPPDKGRPAQPAPPKQGSAPAPAKKAPAPLKNQES